MYWLSRDFCDLDLTFQRLLSSMEENYSEPYSKVTEEDNKIKVSIDLPGVKKDNIKIDAEDRKLKVEAKRDDREITWVRSIPSKVNVKDIEAHLEHGVLEIILPFSEAKSTSITIS